MTVFFVDTSAMLAVLDAGDTAHHKAAAEWARLVGESTPLMTTSYVLVELFALAQARLGLGAVRDIETAVVPLLRVVWVDEPLHARGMAAMLASGRRRLSLVDCVSFEVMRSAGIDTAFAIDRHFVEQGFARIPR